MFVVSSVPCQAKQTIRVPTRSGNVSLFAHYLLHYLQTICAVGLVCIFILAISLYIRSLLLKVFTRPWVKRYEVAMNLSILIHIIILQILRFKRLNGLLCTQFTVSLHKTAKCYIRIWYHGVVWFKIPVAKKLAASFFSYWCKNTRQEEKVSVCSMAQTYRHCCNKR